MKYYLHKILVVRQSYNPNIKEYSIVEFEKFSECLTEFKKIFFIKGDKTTVKNKNSEQILLGRISTSKEKLKPILEYDFLKKEIFVSLDINSKYIGYRNFNYNKNFVIFETNLKKSALEFQEKMKIFQDSKNIYFIHEIPNCSNF